jgi:DNA-binding SARP family transcriptional activator
VSEAGLPHLRVCLLGGFRVWIGKREVREDAFARPMARRLLGLLALEAGAHLHRERIVECLWPDLSLEAAAAQLYKAVHHARRALATATDLPPPFLLAGRGEQLWLSAPGGVSTDLADFEKHAQQALRSRADLAMLEEAAALWGGELLPDDVYAEWAIGARERVSELLVEVLVVLGEARLAAGMGPEAGEAFLAALRHDPAREAAHQGLMRVHAQRGDRTALERQFRRCADALAAAFGLGPSDQTLRLRQTLVSAFSLARPAGSY